jgi:hypothetical protein
MGCFQSGPVCTVCRHKRSAHGSKGNAQGVERCSALIPHYRELIKEGDKCFRCKHVHESVGYCRKVLNVNGLGQAWYCYCSMRNTSYAPCSCEHFVDSATAHTGAIPSAVDTPAQVGAVDTPAQVGAVDTRTPPPRWTGPPPTPIPPSLIGILKVAHTFN